MTPDQEPEPASMASEQPKTSEPARRGRRSGRGRRGRGRRRSPAAAQQPLPTGDEAAEAPQLVAEPTQVDVEAPPRPPPSPAAAPARPQPPPERQPASPAAVQQAIDDVTRIIETLRAALEDMEEVLETLELAERQKTADEQEIETLRRKLHQLHRPREGGQHPLRP